MIDQRQSFTYIMANWTGSVLYIGVTKKFQWNDLYSTV